MKNIEKLKIYFRQLINAEVAIYTNEKVVEEYNKKREEKRPHEPKKINLNEPCLAVGHDYNMFDLIRFGSLKQPFIMGFFLFMGIIGCAMTILLIYSVISGATFLIKPENVILTVLEMLCLFYVIYEWKKETAVVKAQDKVNRENYEFQINNYRKRIAKEKEKYDNDMEVYRKNIDIYDFETEREIVKLKEINKDLKENLKELYDANIVYPKYRNLVAITTIYEYLDSGRCETLEGSNGAYNLYENELRANIVIDSLNQIVTNLNQIKNTQYKLYEQLKEVDDILREINDTGLLNAYYAKATAQAATADRYIIGMTW